MLLGSSVEGCEILQADNQVLGCERLSAEAVVVAARVDLGQQLRLRVGDVEAVDRSHIVHVLHVDLGKARQQFRFDHFDRDVFVAAAHDVRNDDAVHGRPAPRFGSVRF